jgi:hypothetical protein
MKIKYLIIIILLLVPACSVYLDPGQNTETDTVTETITPYIQASDYNFYPIHELKQNNFTSGIYKTEGYVTKIYTCPPCPEGALCKMCMKDNIVISENNERIVNYSNLTENELIVFVSNAEQFKLNKKYRFTIKILAYKTTSEPLNDIELIESALIE